MSLAAPDAIEREVKTQQALKLRGMGMTYRQIAAAMQIPRPTAHRYVVEAFKEARKLTVEEATDARDLEVMRLDDWTLQLQTRKQMTPEGERRVPRELDPRIVDTLLRISERRSSLLGLDAPKTFIPVLPPIETGDFDLSRLSIDQLEALDQLYEAALPPLLLTGSEIPAQVVEDAPSP